MNQNPNIKSSASHADQILSFLESGRSITAMEALRRFKCARLGARILDLKKRGHAIKSQLITLKNGKRVAQYSIEK